MTTTRALPTTELLLIRHGQPGSGVGDPDLSPAGVDEAERLGSWLAHEDVGAVVCSPMLRARETARIASDRMGMTIDAVIDDLREWDLNPVDGASYTALEDLADDHPHRTALEQGRYADFIPDIDRPALFARAELMTDALLTEYEGRRVAVITHGGFINAVMSSLLGIQDTLFFFLPAYTSVNSISVVSGGPKVLARLNDTAHLRAAHHRSAGACSSIPPYSASVPRSATA